MGGVVQSDYSVSSLRERVEREREFDNNLELHKQIKARIYLNVFDFVSHPNQATRIELF